MEEPKLIFRNRNGSEQASISSILFKDNEIWIDEDITQESVNSVIAQLHLIEKECASELNPNPNMNVTLYVSGYGGCATAAMNLCNYIRCSPLSITTVAVNSCYSSSAMIWLSAEKRKIMPHTRIMFHNSSWNVGTSQKRLTATEVMRIYQMLSETDEHMYNMIAEKTNIDKGKLKKSIDGKELWLTAQEAFDKGYATEIINTLEYNNR